MPQSILLLNGPNLNLLGQREPEIYGTETLADHIHAARTAAEELGHILVDFQSNFEGEMCEAVHQARNNHEAVIINAGAWTHSSWALADALSAYDGVVVELHLSNPMRREPWRHTSVVTPVATGLICGFGGLGYPMAVQAVHRMLSQQP